ncbi:unnamed protein product [Calypogeia fissa]
MKTSCPAHIVFPVLPCTVCFPEPSSPTFTPAQSSSYKPLECTDGFCKDLTASGSYASCSGNNTCLYSHYFTGDVSSFIKGNMAYETFLLTAVNGSIPFSNVAFGCATDNWNVGYGAVDGFVGLEQGPLSMATQLGKTMGPTVSYCLVRY